MKNNQMDGMEALLFDCDGVIVDTERDGHRLAFNQAFMKKGLDLEWDVETYGRLLRIGGGKERMRHYFGENGYPRGTGDKDSFIRELHELKTALFMEIIRTGKLPLRPGVARLMEEAHDRGVRLAVCSTSNEKAVRNIVEVLLGEKIRSSISIFAGDMAGKKKPDPEIYNLTVKMMKLSPGRCMVVEDSRNGLLAAMAAGLHCIITRSHYTRREDFSGADAIFSDLGEDAGSGVTVELLSNLTKK
jgi:HAD superfamily hydrolase (TIGR01509 family)